MTGRVRLEGPAAQSDAVVAFDGWARWSGTSFAAASVTGAIAADIQPGRRVARQVLERLLRQGSTDVQLA